MTDNKKGAGGRRRPSNVRNKNTFVTKSGQTIKINRSLTERIQARRDSYAKRRAQRLAGLPKSRVKRIIYRMHPKRLYAYWFSREGAIMALKITGIGIIAGFLLLVGVFAYFRKDLPNLKDISGKEIGGSVLYYDRSGQTLLWEDVNGVKRIPVQDDTIAQSVKDATIAIEDKDFFKHGGFDVRGIFRAAWNNAFGGGGTQGGSTLTQQLVKITNDWTKDRTLKRKVKELILAIELERSYSKKEILTGYLNAAPYGGVEYGVEAAARNYFQKSAKDLTLDEAAMLAAIPKSPTYFSPYNEDYFDREEFEGRQDYILDLMHQQGFIKKEERDEAKNTDTLAKIKPRPARYDGIKAPYFVLLAKRQLENERGDQTVKLGGLKVITTLDLNAQNIAEESVNKGMATVRRNGFDSAAFVAEDVKTGQVVAVVGGSDFTNKEYGQNNYAHWRLPPGSSFKPYDYISLIEHTNDFGAGSVLYDTQGPIDGYPCTNKARPPVGNCLFNYDFRYPGPLTLRYALGGSRNIPAVKAMLLAGVDKTIDTAEKLGLSSGYKCYDPKVEDVNIAGKEDETQCYVSSAIGDGAYLYLDEHVHAYATISRNGNKIAQTYILKVEDTSKRMLYEWKASSGEQVIRDESAYIVADMMADPRASYMGNKPHNYKGHKFSVKTGTTNDSKDGWLMGFSTQYAAGVWVGHHTRRVETRAFMENMTQPIWTGFMQKMHDPLKPEERVKPAGIQTLPAFVVRNHVGVSSVEPSPTNDLFPSWFKKKATTGKKVIDIVSNKLATDCTPARAKKELTEADASALSGDRFANQSGTNTEEKDDVHKCDDVKPSIRLTVTETGSGKYKLSADVTAGTHPLNSAQYPGTVNFKIDDQIVKSYTIESLGVVTYDYTANFSGQRTVSAEIIDSVLYDATDSDIITGGGEGGGGSGAFNFSILSLGSGQYKFNWSAVPGASSYEICIDTSTTPNFVCSAGNPGDTRPVVGSGRKAYIKALGVGTQSDTLNF
jgi:membrane peptidoglycan carboxypeptidase